MKKIKSLFPAQTVSGSCEIDIRFLLKKKHIKRNAKSYGVLEWTGGQRVNYLSRINKEEKFLQLQYLVTNNAGIKTNYDYNIPIVEVNSNLGKGTILYFLCPESGKRSRKLISAYGEPKFINREFYEIKPGLRIYYGCQKTSKADYHNTRYFDIKGEVDRREMELNAKHRNSHYRGKLTRDQKYLRELKIKMEYHNKERTAILAKVLNFKYSLKI